MTVFYLGDEYSFSYKAANLLALGAKLVSAETIDAVLDSAYRENARCVVPLENSVEGSIREVIDRLIAGGFTIERETTLPVHHLLVSSAKATKADIKVVCSHPQALSQCKNYLAKNFPQAEKRAVTSTSKALELAAKDCAVAAIAGSARQNQKVLDENIEDYGGNNTRFFLLRASGDKTVEQSGGAKSSIVFSLPDKPGALYEALGALNRYSVNLTKIESRPDKVSSGNYVFFADIMGNLSDEARNALNKKTVMLRLLGTYDTV